MLQGSEVKSLRLGQVQLADAFARVTGDELWLEGVHIAPYQFANGVGAHDPDRRRKLLLHRDEIDRLSGPRQPGAAGPGPAAAVLPRGPGQGRARARRGAARRATSARRSPSATRKREIERALGRQRKGME